MIQWQNKSSAISLQVSCFYQMLWPSSCDYTNCTAQWGFHQINITRHWFHCPTGMQIWEHCNTFLLLFFTSHLYDVLADLTWQKPYLIAIFICNRMHNKKRDFLLQHTEHGLQKAHLVWKKKSHCKIPANSLYISLLTHTHNISTDSKVHKNYL